MLSHGSQLIPNELLLFCQVDFVGPERKRLSDGINQPRNKPTQSSDPATAQTFPSLEIKVPAETEGSSRTRKPPGEAGQEPYIWSQEMRRACLPSSLLPTLVFPSTVRRIERANQGRHPQKAGQNCREHGPRTSTPGFRAQQTLERPRCDPGSSC